MNVDLKKALEEVRKSFHVWAEGNTVTFRSKELSHDNLKEICRLGNNQHLCPWIFRSGKSVKVVFFLKNEHGEYLLSEGETVVKEVFEEIVKNPDHQQNNFCIGSHDSEAENDELEDDTDRNSEVVSNFIDHCKENGIEIPEEVFESFFNA